MALKKWRTCSHTKKKTFKGTRRVDSMERFTVFLPLLLSQIAQSLRCHDCWAVHLLASNSSTDLCTERPYMDVLGLVPECEVEETDSARIPACRTSISSDDKTTYCNGYTITQKCTFPLDSYGCTMLTEVDKECRLLYTDEHPAMLLCYCNGEDFCNSDFC